jgi:hypothetical protein
MATISPLPNIRNINMFSRLHLHFVRLLVLFFALVTGCSQQPDEQQLEELIRNSISQHVPIMIIGDLLGGTLVSLDEIEIESVERKTREPNLLEGIFGMKGHEYWAVTARVKGVARPGKRVFVGGLRGFHARHIWGVRENDRGQLYVSITDDFAAEVPEQPAYPSVWDINDSDQLSDTDSIRKSQAR